MSRGWFVRICTNETECSSINLWVGLGGEEGSHRFWTTWNSGDNVELAFPGDLQNVSEIWIKGEANPHGRNANFCVFYDDHVVKHMDFDEDEEHEKHQGDQDDECACAH
jgi:hypothetical protein